MLCKGVAQSCSTQTTEHNPLTLTGIPHDINYTMMEEDLKELTGVTALHNLHVWSLTLDKTALAVHLAIGMSLLNMLASVGSKISSSRKFKVLNRIWFLDLSVKI